MRRGILLGFACVMTLAAAGCVAPSEFTARMDIKKDGMYDFTYDGTIKYLTMAEELEKAPLPLEREKELADEFLAKIAEDENASNASYAGKSEFNISYHMAGDMKIEAMHIPSGWGKHPFFELIRGPENGQITFQAFAIAKDENGLAEIPASARDIKGTIILTTELPVVSGTGNPEHKDGTNVYTWTITGVNPDIPSIIMKWDDPTIRVMEPPSPVDRAGPKQ